MPINKEELENNLMDDLYQAICEHDVFELRSQLSVIQRSLGDEIRNQRRDITERDGNLK